MATRTKDRFTKEQLDLIFLEESTYKFNEAAGDYVVCRIFNHKGELVDTITSRKFLKEYNDDVNVGRHNHIFTVTDVLQNGYTTTHANHTQKISHNHEIIEGVVQQHCADYDIGGGILSRVCHSHDDLPIYLDIYKLFVE